MVAYVRSLADILCMKVKYNPDRNLEARLIRQLIGTREFVTAREICDELDVLLPGLTEIMVRQDQWITALDWPLNPASEIVACKHDLIAGKEYEVLLVESGSYRILSEGAYPQSKPEPYLFHHELFELLDCAIPNGWAVTWYGGELVMHPSVWDDHFFVDLFEGVPKAQDQFTEGLKLQFPETYQRWLTYQQNKS